MSELHPLLQTRPGMYLAMYDQKFNAASICENFLNAVVRSPGFSNSIYIDVNVSQSHFIITAMKWHITNNLELLENLFQVFNVDNFRPGVLADISAGLGFLAPIVWFTEYCTVDFKTEAGVYQQAFLNGRPLGESVLSTPSRDLASQVSFYFTLSSPLFESQTMDITELRHWITLWRKVHSSSRIPQSMKAPKSCVKWKQQDAYSYILRILFPPDRTITKDQ